MSKMHRRSERGQGRFSGSLFAATFVVTVGGGLCVTISFLFAPDLSWRSLTVICCGVVGLTMLILLLNQSPVRRARDSNLYAAQKQTLSEYVESFRPDLRGGKKRRHFGTNKPPTADDLRQIKEDANTWHPSERRVDQYRKALDENND